MLPLNFKKFFFFRGWEKFPTVNSFPQPTYKKKMKNKFPPAKKVRMLALLPNSEIENLESSFIQIIYIHSPQAAVMVLGIKKNFSLPPPKDHRPLLTTPTCLDSIMFQLAILSTLFNRTTFCQMVRVDIFQH